MPTADPYAALRNDGGIRSILESSIGLFHATSCTPPSWPRTGPRLRTVFPRRRAPSCPSRRTSRRSWRPGRSSSCGRCTRTTAPSSSTNRSSPVKSEFATIRIGVSPLLVRSELQVALRTAAGTVVAVLAISMLVAMLLAQWMLRPIHVIQSGLSRLGRGELDVRLDLPEGGSSRTSAARSKPSARRLRRSARPAPPSRPIPTRCARAGAPTSSR